MSALNHVKCLVVGIGGVTNGGKTSLCTYLKQRFPSASVINMDDYYYEEDSPHHIWIEGLDHADWDVVSSVDMSRLHSDIKAWVNMASQASDKPGLWTGPPDNLPSIVNTHQGEGKDCEAQGNEQLGQNGQQANQTNNHVNKLPMLFVEGILIYNYKPILPYFNKKYFFTLDKETCYERRKGRHYVPPDKEGYFDQVAWPRYLQYKQEIDSVTDIVYLDGNAPQSSICQTVDADLQSLMAQQMV